MKQYLQEEMKQTLQGSNNFLVVTVLSGILSELWKRGIMIQYSWNSVENLSRTFCWNA